MPAPARCLRRPTLPPCESPSRNRPATARPMRWRRPRRARRHASPPRRMRVPAAGIVSWPWHSSSGARRPARPPTFVARTATDAAQHNAIRVDTSRATRFNWSGHLTRASPAYERQRRPAWPVYPEEEYMRDLIRALSRCLIVAGLAASARGRRAGTHHAARRRAVQRRPRVQPSAREIPGADRQVLRQADQFRACTRTASWASRRTTSRT